MKIRYALVAALLAGGLLAAPAFAGVTGTTGGSKSDVTTTNKNYEIEKHYKTVYGSGSSTSNTVVTGTATRHEWVGTANSATGWRDTSDSYSKTVSGNLSDPSVQRAISNMASTTYNSLYSEAGRTGGGCGYNSNASTGSSSYSYTTYTPYSFTGRNTVLDSTESTSNDSYAPNSIVVGDTDALANAHVAQGSVNRSTTIEKNYTHHDTYTRTATVHTVTTNYYSIDGTRTVSPIVLDLDGDGAIEASSGKYLAHPGDFDSSRMAMFDYAGNDFPVLTEWVGANDGLLCRPSADGCINGTNLFGTSNGHTDGYAEMATLDANGDGQLDGAELEGLQVWTDSNGNAITEASELHSLNELGITSISVNHDNMKSTFVRNGETFNSYDWWPNVIQCRKVDMAQK